MPFREECRFDSDRPHHHILLMLTNSDLGLGSPLDREDWPNGH